MYIQVDNEALRALAGKYVWWKTPEEALLFPERLIAQVMDMGDYADVQLLVRLLGEEVLCEVLRQAQAGQFNERSWAYWHHRLGLADIGNVPPLPVRKFE